MGMTQSKKEEEQINFMSLVQGVTFNLLIHLLTSRLIYYGLMTENTHDHPLESSKGNFWQTISLSAKIMAKI